MTFRCVISDSAETDLEEIADYISQYNPLAAKRLVSELRASCFKITQFPKAWPLRPDIDENLRSRSYGDYLILYTITDDVIIIEAIVHGARDLSNLFH